MTYSRQAQFHPLPRCVRSGQFWVVCGLVLTLASTFARAHEGHKALPTKGARVEGNTVFLSSEAHKALGLSTAEVDLKDLKRTVLATARVVAPWKGHAMVTTRVSGRIEKLFAKPGDFVKAGQTLAEIESLELENEQLELIQVNLELELARKTLQRLELLGGKGIVPGKDVLAAKTMRLENRVL